VEAEFSHRRRRREITEEKAAQTYASALLMVGAHAFEILGLRFWIERKADL
jgi:hypothetical protein